MKILFLTGIDINNPTLVGVKKKIDGQADAMRSLGHDVVLSYYDKELLFEYSDNKKDRVTLKNNSIISRIESYKAYFYNTLNNNYDMVIVRVNELNFFLLLELKRIKKNNKKIKIILELPTYPTDKEADLLQKKLFKEKKYSKLLQFLVFRTVEVMSRPLAKYVADWIVTYSLHKCIYGIRTICIGNGVNINDIKLKSLGSYYHEDETINILGVGNLSNWHGFDRVIKGLADYKGNKVIKFHIIGTGPEEEKLKVLTEKLGLTSIVIFHGLKKGSELDSIFEQCDIAISSLGMHRIGLKEGAVLKTREYCARGIPFIYAYNDVDISEEHIFALKIPADETSINIINLINFNKLNKLNNNTNLKMRQFAEKRFTWLHQIETVFLEVEKEGHKS